MRMNTNLINRMTTRATQGIAGGLFTNGSLPQVNMGNHASMGNTGDATRMFNTSYGAAEETHYMQSVVDIHYAERLMEETTSRQHSPTAYPIPFDERDLNPDARLTLNCLRDSITRSPSSYDANGQMILDSLHRLFDGDNLTCSPQEIADHSLQHAYIIENIIPAMLEKITQGDNPQSITNIFEAGPHGHLYCFGYEVPKDSNTNASDPMDRVMKAFESFMGKSSDITKRPNDLEAIFASGDRVTLPNNGEIRRDINGITVAGRLAVTTEQHALHGVLYHFHVINQDGRSFMIRMGAGAFPIEGYRQKFRHGVDLTNCIGGAKVWQYTDWHVDRLAGHTSFSENAWLTAYDKPLNAFVDGGTVTREMQMAHAAGENYWKAPVVNIGSRMVQSVADRANEPWLK